ncbi:hypothetical protein GCM10023075_69580 [Streptosporangium album]
MPGASNAEERFFIQPTRRVTKGGFTVATRWRLEAPQITMRTADIKLEPEYYNPVWFSDLSPQYPRLDGSALLTAVDAGRGTPEDLKGKNLRGRLALIRRTEGIPVAVQSNAAAAAGAKLVAIYCESIYRGSSTPEATTASSTPATSRTAESPASASTEART